MTKCDVCTKETDDYYLVGITPSLSMQNSKGIAGKTYNQNLRICDECTTKTVVGWAVIKEKTETLPSEVSNER